MSHENPYISRDVDIDAYVLQTDTAMNPYIVHMKTDAPLARYIPKSIRSKDAQKSVDVGTRAKLIKDFTKKIAKLLKQIDKISNECIEQAAEVKKQLTRIGKEQHDTAEDKLALENFSTVIDEFTDKVKKSHFEFLVPK